MSERWPAIPYAEWQPTCSALHLYLQIVGKYRDDFSVLQLAKAYETATQHGRTRPQVAL